jgi:hypothetical protein
MIRSIKVLLLLALMGFAGITHGQPYLGAFGGLNFGKLFGDVPMDAAYKSLPGANVGINFDIKLSRVVWLSFQPSYTQEGTRIEYTYYAESDPIDIDSAHIRLNYFSLPLMLKVTSTNERFYAIGGIETGYLLDKKLTSHDVENEFENNVSEWNVAAHFGLGMRIPVGLPRIFIELRYTQGLVNLTDEPMEKSYIPRVKTSGFKLFAGVEFPLKKTSK